MADKTLYIIGGPNGAGKTTIANRLLSIPSNDFEYIGADLIAAELSPADPSLAQIEAGREFMRRTQACFQEGRNCLLESTLSGRSLTRTIATAHSLGYRIEIQFIFIESAEFSLARVQQRVAKGGHDVPEADVMRRYARTIRNFWGLYRPMADYWTLTYNGEVGAFTVAFGTPQRHFIVSYAVFEKFLEVAEVEDASD
jgi:predicted ABC-type ATPase